MTLAFVTTKATLLRGRNPFGYICYTGWDEFFVCPKRVARAKTCSSCRCKAEIVGKFGRDFRTFFKLFRRHLLQKMPYKIGREWLTLSRKILKFIEHVMYSVNYYHTSLLWYLGNSRLSNCVHLFDSPFSNECNRPFHRSGTKCPLNVTDPWFKNVDEGKINFSMFLDLKKAFRTVDHKNLLSMLQEYGADRISHSWFTSYLINREKVCYYEGSSSSMIIGHKRQ